MKFDTDLIENDRIYRSDRLTWVSLMDIARIDVDCRQMPTSTFFQVFILFPNLKMIRIQSLPSVRELTSKTIKKC
jgi:hypothetical protein